MDSSENLPQRAAPESPTAPTAGGIFVVGAQRSGTKWLSNILCNHPDVAGLQSEFNGGIMETNLLGRFQRCFGDLSYPDHYVALIELLAQSDYFKASGLDKSMFYTPRPRPSSYVQVFKMLMEGYAASRGKSFWLQKVAPNSAMKVLHEFPNVKLVSIRRRVADAVASSRQNKKNHRIHAYVVRLAATYGIEEKTLRNLERRRRFVVVQYEDLKRDTVAETRRICEDLGLSFDPKMVEVTYKPNTSFTAVERRGLTSRESVLARMTFSAVSSIPLPILRGVRAVFGNRDPSIVAGTFSSIKREYGISLFS